MQSYEQQVTPDTWTPRGEALVERGKKPLTVFGGIPGELATVKIDHRGQNRDHGHWLHTDTPSPHRVEPACGRYALCGGCPIMHLDLEGQELARRDVVRAALDEAGLEDVLLGDWHASPDGIADFRHVVKVGFGYSDRGHTRVGAWGRLNRRIVPIPKCTVALPVLRRTMTAIAHFAIELDLKPWTYESGGLLRAAVIRASRTTGEVLVTLVAARRARILRDYAEAIAGQVSDVAGVWVHLNSDPGNSIFARSEDGVIGVQPLIGKATIDETLGDITYAVGPTDFFQTNPGTAEVLYRRVLERLDLEDGVPVIDLYCGVGGLALQAAQRTGFAIGVEENDGAVLRARENTRRHGLTAEFISGRVEDALEDLGRRFAQSQPVITVNPARRGLEEGVIQGIVALRPSKIAYVSCNPRALARDLAIFRAEGFDVGEVELFDMFPNTPHVETLVTLHGAPRRTTAARAPRRRLARGGKK